MKVDVRIKKKAIHEITRSDTKQIQGSCNSCHFVDRLS
jgi:hypothetical protein